MECAVAAMLEGSEHVIPNDKDLSEAERKALMRLTMEEVRLCYIKDYFSHFVHRLKREDENYVECVCLCPTMNRSAKEIKESRVKSMAIYFHVFIKWLFMH